MSGRQASYAVAVLVLAVVTLIVILLPGLRRAERVKPRVPLAVEENRSPEFRPTHALSLRVFQAQLAQHRGKLRQAGNLGGMNVIDGLVIEPDGEILLLGQAITTLPPLSVHDLAVALRNAYAVSPVYSGTAGCTIDPREGATDPLAIQVVKVFGMPRDCPMAARFVTIDYEMKRVSAGIVSLRRDLRSLYELHRLQAPFCEGERGGRRVIESTHRFWFCAKVPDSPRYWENERVIWIRKPVQVQLLTERQYLDAVGRRVAKGPADPAALEFARAISDVLQENEIPSYVQLKSDFRLLELAQILHYKRVPPEELEYLLHHHEVPSESVPLYVGEIRRKERGEVVCESRVWQESSGLSTLHRSERTEEYEQVSRGGVWAEVPVSPSDFGAESLEVLKEVRERAMASRPPTDDFIWVIGY